MLDYMEAAAENNAAEVKRRFSWEDQKWVEPLDNVERSA